MAMTRHTTAQITVPSAFITALSLQPSGFAYAQRTNMPACEIVNDTNTPEA